MDIRASFAALNYSAVRPATAPRPSGGDSPGEAFSKAATSFADTLRRGEETARAAITGGADAHSLVQALSQTQLAVETVVTVRDRVVEAYQEILRMPV
ncbi:MAG: flagellar hook-basal body complex protein FliE [Alkalilacustris sp.]